MQVQMSSGGRVGEFGDIPVSSNRLDSAAIEGVIKDWVIKDALKAEQKKVDEKERLTSTVNTVNKFLEPLQTSLHFKLHEKTNAYYVQIVNSANGEVIREVPSEKMMDLRYALEKYIGISIDQKI